MRVEGVAESNDPKSAPPPPVAAAPKQEFLRLLVAQLRHQDPLDPQKGSEFVAQLAQFATLEQSAETNQKLSDIAGNQLGASASSYAALVGRTATARCEGVTITAGPPPELGAHLEAAAAKAEVVISDANGNRVRTITLGPREAGDLDFTWDGKSDSGVALPPGAYKVALDATTADGTAVAGFTTLRGVVSALQFNGGAPRFRIGPATISPSDIISIH